MFYRIGKFTRFILERKDEEHTFVTLNIMILLFVLFPITIPAWIYAEAKENPRR